MQRVLVTGGRGVLGSELVPRLAASGYTVRIMSRHARSADGEPAVPTVEWAQADLETGEGLLEAVAGVDVIVHAASNPLRRTRVTDVEGTRKVLARAHDAGISHFVYISIVGIERIPFPYYKAKLAAESLIKRSGLPYTIQRATQFYPLIDMGLQAVARPPVVLLPLDLRFQPIDVSEVAGRLFECVQAGPSGSVSDIAGPKVYTLRELVQAWMGVRGLRKPLVNLPLPGRVAQGFRRGYNTAPEHKHGKITWEEWLQGKYGRMLSAEC